MKTLKWKLLTSLFVVTVLVFSASIIYAMPINLHITSGSDWIATDSDPGEGWTDVEFDDSAWINAYAPYPTPNTPQDVIPGASGEFMWYWDQSYPLDGISGPGIAYFRYEFTLDLTPDSLPLVAQALLAVDDDFELYMNGQLLLESHDHGGPDDVFFVDFTSKLQNGENVLAIKGIDGWSDTTGQDRLYERVLFDGRISTIPEPSTLLLLSVGMIGVLALRRRGLRK